jgi:hypothetical protein
MQKLKLEMESLRVESFKTSPEPAAQRGTVRGYEYETYWCTAPSSQGPYHCLPAPWSWQSCP